MKQGTTPAPLGQEVCILLHILNEQARAIARVLAMLTALHRRLDGFEGRERPEEAQAGRKPYSPRSLERDAPRGCHPTWKPGCARARLDSDDSQEHRVADHPCESKTIRCATTNLY